MNYKDLGKKERRRYVRKEGNVEPNSTIREKRKFIRFNFNDEIEFTECIRVLKKGSASTINISQAGMRFRAKTRLKEGSILAIKANPKQVKRVVKLDKLVCESDGELLGTVVRVEKERNSEYYQIGVAFLQK